MRAKTARSLLLAYSLKTLLIGIAWVLAPGWPQKAYIRAREIWSLVLSANARTGTALEKHEVPKASKGS